MDGNSFQVLIGREFNVTLWKKCYAFYLLSTELAETGSFDKYAQLFQNYDYIDLSSGPGTSVYRDMTDGKVKSVSEWKKKKRKQRKKNIERILNQKLR